MFPCYVYEFVVFVFRDNNTLVFPDNIFF